jgi:energy-coupling factor transport system substrate-specific component
MLNSRQASMVSALVAVGAVTRIALGQLALGVPSPFYGIMIKVGLTETLAFVSGFVFGPVIGFLCGAMIIVTSDLFMIPGPWTPFIAAIVGIFGLAGAMIRRFRQEPSTLTLGASAVLFTVLSELLQNSWFALFFNLPIVATLTMGIPSTLSAIANNTILLTTVGAKTIKLIEKAMPRSLNATSA